MSYLYPWGIRSPLPLKFVLLRLHHIVLPFSFHLYLICWYNIRSIFFLSPKTHSLLLLHFHFLILPLFSPLHFLYKISLNCGFCCRFICHLDYYIPSRSSFVIYCIYSPYGYHVILGHLRFLAVL